MAIISWDEGHGTGQDRGAEGFLNEEKVIREYAPICIAELQRHGHTLINCNPPNAPMTVNESLAYRSKHANDSGSILHLCFHVDAYDDASANGAEIEVGSTNGAKYGQSVLNEIVKLGFASRGVKTPSLWMTGSKVNAVSILIEPFFCTNKADCNLYNKTSLGLACAKGILNIIGGTITPTASIKFRKLIKIIKQTPLIDSNGANIRTFKVNDEVTAVDEDKNWWILPSGSISKVNTIEIKVQYGEVTASNLFVRQESHATATKLGSLNKGSKVQINKIDGDWINIVYNGGFGWVFGKYITLQ
ncbi:N-acetylmuramoyl-L-alanine amidase [Clostridium estertheticum]|uniref:N-acetylmuramoyl-L-alanine amidase n=1 Tax=Clostridium estertheticum TaxID=238834 RepID=UPI00124DCECF|nr:N-acetylmuramoyl-L-alanine amidase [Clostridium estertheticum]MBZ9615277.1 N-acetylmuramoyl-L-alanine amidase [Clostridium estertheticum subsp. laramiense]WAG75166.1 N-acetylmuramoyl-L-alanine amidase [Clostridium estertheticum]